MKKWPLIFCWLVGAPSIAFAVLIIVPAPTYYLWMVAVAASEWSVWLVLSGLVTFLCGATALSIDRRSKAARLSIAFSLVTLICASLPVVEAYRVAGREGVSLSWSRYLFGVRHVPFVVIDEQRDVEFARPDGQAILLDIYHPRSSDKRGLAVNLTSTGLLPAIIVIHGGSWRSGTKSDFAQYDRWLAENGRVVFDVNYRLANPTQHFPAQLLDVEFAILWVKSHAAHYSVDPNRIALLGRSAGGQLALLAAYTAIDSTRNPVSRDSQDTRVRAVISFYGPTDLSWDYDHPGRPDVIGTRQVLENYLDGSPATASPTYAAASPIEHVNAQSPPTLFLHGGHDQIVRKENVERIIPKLTAAGVPYSYIYLPWANHGFDYNFNGWSSQIVQAEISKFLDEYL